MVDLSHVGMVKYRCRLLLVGLFVCGLTTISIAQDPRGTKNESGVLAIEAETSPKDEVEFLQSGNTGRIATITGTDGSARVFTAGNGKSITLVFNNDGDGYLISDCRDQEDGEQLSYSIPICVESGASSTSSESLNLYMTGVYAKDAGTTISVSMTVDGIEKESWAAPSEEVVQFGESKSKIECKEEIISLNDFELGKDTNASLKKKVVIDIDIKLKRVGKNDGFAMVDLHHMTLSLQSKQE